VREDVNLSVVPRNKLSIAPDLLGGLQHPTIINGAGNGAALRSAARLRP
jgi:hypothetical protein